MKTLVVVALVVTLAVVMMPAPPVLSGDKDVPSVGTFRLISLDVPKEAKVGVPIEFRVTYETGGKELEIVSTCFSGSGIPGRWFHYPCKQAHVRSDQSGVLVIRNFRIPVQGMFKYSVFVEYLEDGVKKSSNSVESKEVVRVTVGEEFQQ